MRPILLLAVLLAAPFAGALPPLAPDFAERILKEDDPVQARVFLADHALFDRLYAADAVKARYLKTRALELVDIETVLLWGRADRLSDPKEIRLALSVRPLCRFCQDFDRTLAWVKRYHSLTPRDQGFLAAAYMHWATLPPFLRELVVRQGHDEARWKALKLADRMLAVKDAVEDRRQALLKELPANEAAADKLVDGALEVGNYLEPNVRDQLLEHAARHRSVFRGLKELPKGLLASNAEAVRRARSGATLEERLEGLKALFDQAGPRQERGAFRPSDAPVAGVEKAAPAALARFTEALSEALAGEMAASTMGGIFKQLYETYQPPVARIVRVRDFPPQSFSSIAHFLTQEGAVEFNKRGVDRLLKARGLDYEAAARDPAVMRDLARLMSVTYAHEVMHHAQHEARRRVGFETVVLREDEVEAFQAESLFVLAKLRQDPAFRATIEASAKRKDDEGRQARHLLGTAYRAEHEGLGGLERLSDVYSVFQTMGSHAWCAIADNARGLEPIRRELERRASLPREEREALENGPDFAATYLDRATLDKAYRTVGTPYLRQHVLNHEPIIDQNLARERFVADWTRHLRGELEKARTQVLEAEVVRNP